MELDQAYLIKSDAIRTSEDSVLMVLYYYHAEFSYDKGIRHTIKDKTFYKCIVRNDTIDNWNKLADHIQEDNPAELFRLSHMGLSDNLILKGKHLFTKYSFSKWLKKKLLPTKIHTPLEFIEGHRIIKRYSHKYTEGAFTAKLPYVKLYHYNDIDYDLSDPLSFPLGVWMEGIYVAHPRKKPLIIKD